MPSTSAKQHRFMEAIAHNSAFAKKAGVPQSVGKDFSAADKGKRFAGGGAATQKINRQDTQHGAMDMPFKSVKKFGKTVRRFDGEEGSFVDGRPFAETKATEDRTVTRSVPGSAPSSPPPKASTGSASFKAAFAAARKEGGKTFDYNGKSYSTDLAKPSKDYGDESARMLARAPRTETATETVPTPAVTGRAAKISNKMPSLEQKQRNAENLPGAVMEGAMYASGVGGAARGAARGLMGLAARRAAGEMTAKNAMDKAARGTAEQVATTSRMKDMEGAADRGFRQRLKEGESGRRSGPMDESMKKGGKVDTKKPNPFMEMIAKKKAMAKDKKPEMKFAKGGSIRRMADGGMTAPMGPMAPQAPVDPRQLAAMQAAMQAQGGAPMAPPPAPMPPPAPGMKRGGSVKFAKGGGIESRGKTKGTIIRMASGGSVSSASRRADGIAQRGKTRG